MGVFNKITPMGMPYPPEDYPNPVVLVRPIVHTLFAADATGTVDMKSPEAVAEFAESVGDGQTKAWILANKDEYLRALTDGLEVKRYRIILSFDDGSSIVMRESDDLESIKKYGAELHQGWKQNGFTLSARTDKGVDVGRIVRNSDGTDEFMVQLIFRITPIPARQYTPVEKQRYPSETDIDLQRKEGGTPNVG